MKTKILVMQRHAPYGASLARDGLDFILTAAAYEQDLSVLFSGDGVFQLLPEQKADVIHAKPQDKALEILPLYDVEQLYVVQEDLLERNISELSLCCPVSIISRQQAKTLIAEQDKVIGF
ncbi:sulfurtransferase complex subunit TusC [Bermanella sp. R86510]|uniref:sulfurtransferase complex subunit TusC n=1 Tax=unclassified Bermanella TaxID=2627862 RepID=UPI0037C8F70B